MTSAPNELHAYLRTIRQNRSSSFFRLTDVLQAEQRRMGLESILEKGLLHEILQYLDLGDVQQTRLYHSKQALMPNYVSSLSSSPARASSSTPKSAIYSPRKYTPV